MLGSFQEDKTTLEGKKKSDARVMLDFYRGYYQKYIQALQADKADRLVSYCASMSNLTIL